VRASAEIAKAILIMTDLSPGMLKKSISGSSPSMSTEFWGWDMKGEAPFATDPMAVGSAKEVVTGCRPQVEVACYSVDKDLAKRYKRCRAISIPKREEQNAHFFSMSSKRFDRPCHQ